MSFFLKVIHSYLRLLPCLPVPSYLPFNNVLYKAVPTQDVTSPVSLSDK